MRAFYWMKKDSVTSTLRFELRVRFTSSKCNRFIASLVTRSAACSKLEAKRTESYIYLIPLRRINF